MFNEGKFDSIITEYKKQFIQSQWPKEKFKWEAVKCFQDNWDINADDFIEMLKKSLAKTENLLSSKNNFPKDTIINLAKVYPNEVCKMFMKVKIFMKEFLHLKKILKLYLKNLKKQIIVIIKLKMQ